MALLPFREFLDGLLVDAPFDLNFHDVTGCFRQGNLALPTHYFRHQAPLCNVAKRTQVGLQQCLGHKATAVQKLLRERKPFWLSCPCGMEEYIFPLFYEEQLLGIGFLGGRFVFSKEAKEALQTASGTIGVPVGQLTEAGEHCGFSGMEKDRYPAAKRGQAVALSLAITGYLARLHQEEPPRIPRDSRSFLEYAKGQAARHYQKQLSIGLLASLYGLNGKYAGSLFKSQVGESFQAYVNRIRIRRACELLRNSDLSVLQIAYEVGFQSVPYFNRCFLKSVGIPPRQYRSYLSFGER